MIPAPRPPVADPALTRPDWTHGSSRNPKLLWLDKNENTDPEHLARVTEILGRIPPATYATYPEAWTVYDKLARWVGVEPSQLVLAAGSDGIIRSIFESFISPGDIVITTSPTFAMYDVYCRIYGATKVALEYRWSSTGPELTGNEVVDAIRTNNPRLVCIPNPDSPTGSVFSHADIMAIIRAAGNAGAVMLVDEAYYPFHEETVVPLIEEFSHLVVARSTAKAWGLAGLRIGYAITSPELARILHKVRPMYECSTFGMVGLSSILDHPELMAATVFRLEAGKAHFLKSMESLRLRTLQGKGNFLHVDFADWRDAVHSALSNICYYRKDFQEPCLKGFSRFSSTTVERFKPVIETIANVVKGSSVHG